MNQKTGNNRFGGPKYKDYEGVLVNNLQYKRPAKKSEIDVQVPHTFFPGFDDQKNTWNDYLVDTRITQNKYWIAECIKCGETHIVRADKIKNKQCKHKGDQRP